MSDHFYLTLPSEASRYTTRLPERIRLEGDFEVGLTELVYPHKWNNVDNRDGKYWFGLLGSDARTYVRTDYYPNGRAFASSLTHQIARKIDDVVAEFSFSERTDRIRMQITNTPDKILILSSKLLDFLGFRLPVVAKRDMDVIGHHPFDVNRGLHLMYVYCDVAAERAIGDSRAPLLRVCNVSGKRGRSVHVVYDRPHYVPVGRREFDAVEIAINNEIGKPMEFDFGRVLVTLHFRRR